MGEWKFERQNDPRFGLMLKNVRHGGYHLLERFMILRVQVQYVVTEHSGTQTEVTRNIFLGEHKHSELPAHVPRLPGAAERETDAFRNPFLAYRTVDVTSKVHYAYQDPEHDFFLEVDLQYRFTPYSKDPAHENTGLLPAARLHPEIFFRCGSAGAHTHVMVKSISFDMNMQFSLDVFLHGVQLSRNKKARMSKLSVRSRPNMVGLFRDPETFPAPALEMQVLMNNDMARLMKSLGELRDLVLKVLDKIGESVRHVFTSLANALIDLGTFVARLPALDPVAVFDNISELSIDLDRFYADLGKLRELAGQFKPLLARIGREFETVLSKGLKLIDSATPLMKEAIVYYGQFELNEIKRKVANKKAYTAIAEFLQELTRAFKGDSIPGVAISGMVKAVIGELTRMFVIPDVFTPEIAIPFIYKIAFRILQFIYIMMLLKRLIMRMISVISAYMLFDATEKPARYEVLTRGIQWDHSNATWKKNLWDNIHWFGNGTFGNELLKSLISAPGAFHALHMHWRWGHVLQDPSEVEDGILRQMDLVLGSKKGQSKAGRSPLRSLLLKQGDTIGLPLIDPRIPYQTIEFAIVKEKRMFQLQSQVGSLKPFWEIVADSVKQAESIENGTDLTLLMSIQVHNYDNRTQLTGKILPHGFYFAHSEEAGFSAREWKRASNMFFMTEGIKSYRPIERMRGELPLIRFAK